jgi:hypothetical protein
MRKLRHTSKSQAIVGPPERKKGRLASAALA